MKPLWVVALAGMVLGGCATLQYGSPQATARLRNPAGDVVGRARLWEDASGVRILASVRGLSPGSHGIHIHAAGRCDPPDFASAGSHFNPTGKQHGLKNPAGPHAGDLPNLEVAADGKGRLSYVTSSVTLASGSTSLFGANGTALVIHANPDDELTDPSGNSGARIACGVIQKAS